MAKPNEDRAARFLKHLEPLEAALEAYCRRSLRDPSAVQDVLQETVGKAFRDFHLYAEGTNFRAWIFRYLNLEIYAGNRSFRRERHEALVDEPIVEEVWAQALDEPSVERLLETFDELLGRCDEAIAAAVDELNSLERSVLLLRSIGQFKHREISEVLEVPMGTVMSALSRARTRLRQRLAKYAREHGLLGPRFLSNPK